MFSDGDGSGSCSTRSPLSLGCSGNMRWPLLAILLFAVPVSADTVPCRDETRKIAALKDRIASLDRTLEAERFAKIDTNYKYIVATLALNKSEAVVASLKVENARLKAGPVPIAASAVPVPPISAKLIPPSSKYPRKILHVTALKKKKQKHTPHKPHSWNVVKPFWP
jgi:hypothetical protein